MRPMPGTLADLFAHMIERDLYHAGQINLLRHLLGQMDS